MDSHHAVGSEDLYLQLAQMPHQALIVRQGEDWAGVVSQKERKRLQNRLNQRAYRVRKSRQRDPEHTPASKTTTTGNTELVVSQKRANLQCFTQQALESYAASQPTVDHLLKLIHLNVVNSFTRNASLLRLEVDWLICTVVSPIGTVDAVQNKIPPCPPNLIPTALQLQIPHHPWIDLFPLPRMRDNFLIATSGGMSDEDEEQLWDDLVESKSVGGADWAGLLVWGEAWDPRSWEATVPFLRRWGWLLQGCPEIINSTNYWRRQRGEMCLSFGTELLYEARSIDN